jgi:hypothetical protein
MLLLILDARSIVLAGVLLGAVAIGACTSLRPVQPAEFLAKNSPEIVWVTHVNNTIVPVSQPEISGDTLKGMWRGTQRPVAIPMGEIRRVQAKLPDRTKTVIFVAGALTGFATSVYAIWISKAGPNPNGIYCGTYGSSTQGPVGGFIPYC